MNTANIVAIVGALTALITAAGTAVAVVIHARNADKHDKGSGDGTVSLFS